MWSFIRFFFSVTLKKLVILNLFSYFIKGNLRSIINVSVSYLIWDLPRYLMGFPGSSAGKESTYNARDPSVTPGSGSSPREGKGYPLQCSWGSSGGKEFASNVGGLGLIPGLGRHPG